MVDGGGVGGGVVDQIRAKALHCFEVQFGAKDDTPHTTWGSRRASAPLLQQAFRHVWRSAGVAENRLHHPERARASPSSSPRSSSR